MNIYFACSSAEIEKHKETYLQVIRSIKELGHKISVDWLERSLEDGKSDQEWKEIIKKEGIRAIKRSDALIAEVSLPSSSVGYQVALAISDKRPVLCLYSADFGEKKPPKVIDANSSSLLRINKYSRSTLRQIVSKFLISVAGKRLVKFNFIVTPEIEEYLDWASKDGKNSKSEILREKVINEIIPSDKEYQRYLKKFG